jgi:cell division septation protein DedD
VNLLCDRALEAAFARQLRTIDASLVDAAASALGLDGAPAAPADPVPERLDAPESTLAETTVIAKPLQFPSRHPVEIPRAVDDELTPEPMLDSPPPASRRPNILAGALVLVLATAAAYWYMTRVTEQTDKAPPTATSAPKTAPIAAPPVTAASAGQPAAGAPAPSPTVPPAAPPSGGAAAKPDGTPALAPPAPTTAAAASSAGHTQSFEIVVASFRTEPRAAALAQQVTDAGLKVRRREVGGWLQVLAGPFASREEADAAHQRLDEAGLTGSQVIAIER